MNRLKPEIEDRTVRLQELRDRFAFLLNLHSVAVAIADEKEREKLQKECSDFERYYDNDVKAVQLCDEIIDFVMLFQAGGSTVPPDPKDILESLLQFGRDVFPTMCVAYRLLLTIAFSIASFERSFSKLKLIKTHLRSSM